MRRLLHEPLLHFFILGALLFALYAWLHGGVAKAPNEIVLSAGQVQSLTEQFKRVQQRPPTAQELQGLLDNWVREEIYYREGLAMGLDRDDPVVRRRVGQKLEFIFDRAAPAPPTATELQAWLDAHADEYRMEPRYSLRQVYFDPARHTKNLQAQLAAARPALDAGKAVMGDSTMLPPVLDGATDSEVRGVFGEEFADALKALPVGGWQGPVQSGFGAHLVQLRVRDGGRHATLEEVHAAVERDLLHARKVEADAVRYKKLRASYDVRVEAAMDTPAAAAAAP